MTLGEFDPVGMLRTLKDGEVDCLVVGGFAAVAHGSPLPTADVDILVEPSLGNLARLSVVLSGLDARIRIEGIPEGLTFSHSARSLHGMSMVNLVTRQGALDLIIRPEGYPAYDELAARALTVELEGFGIQMASLKDVIWLKQIADRPKDRSALPVLEALQRRLEGRASG